MALLSRPYAPGSDTPHHRPALPFREMSLSTSRKLFLGLLALGLILAAYALLVPPDAFAEGDGGVGTAGRITDKYITFFCFGVIAFFAIFVTVMSLIQGRLDARKEQRRHDLDRFNT